MNINLEPREVTVILQALSEQPYKESAAIIHKIVAQTSVAADRKKQTKEVNQ